MKNFLPMLGSRKGCIYEIEIIRWACHYQPGRLLMAKVLMSVAVYHPLAPAPFGAFARRSVQVMIGNLSEIVLNYRDACLSGVGIIHTLKGTLNYL